MLADGELSDVFVPCALPISFLLPGRGPELLLGQLHEKVLKEGADRERTGERKLRYLRDGPRCALEKALGHLDVNPSYERVRIYLRYLTVLSLSNYRLGRTTLRAPE